MNIEQIHMRTSLLHLARDILESQSRAKATMTNFHPCAQGEDVITTEQIINEAKAMELYVLNN